MQLTTILFAAVASAAPLVERQITTEFKPWQLTRLNTHKPSGRPGNDPESIMRITIEDPNSIALLKGPTGYVTLSPLTSECTIEWIAPDVPYGVPQTCSGDDWGNFTVTIVEGDGEFQQEGDFGLEFKEFREVKPYGTLFQRTFEASAKFKTGDNLQQSCGGSGVCGWQLIEAPQEIKQELTESVGDCETATIGSC